MLTLTDPRLALWERRKVAMEKLALMRMYRGALCGCTRCNDTDRIEELDALIQRATEAITELSDQICERLTSPTPSARSAG